MIVLLINQLLSLRISGYQDYGAQGYHKYGVQGFIPSHRGTINRGFLAQGYRAHGAHGFSPSHRGPIKFEHRGLFPRTGGYHTYGAQGFLPWHMGTQWPNYLQGRLITEVSSLHAMMHPCPHDHNLTKHERSRCTTYYLDNSYSSCSGTPLLQLRVLVYDQCRSNSRTCFSCSLTGGF